MNKNKYNINKVVENVLFRSIFISSLIIGFVSVFFHYIIFIYNNNNKIRMDLINLEIFSRIYENSIIVSYNNQENHRQALFQIEKNNNVLILTSSKDDEISSFKKDCIDYNNFNIFLNKSYICLVKKVTYSKEQFTYIIKKKYNSNYFLYLQFILLFIILLFISVLLTIILLRRNKILSDIEKDTKRFEICLNLIQKGEYNKCNEILKKIKIIELYNAVVQIIGFNKKIKMASKESTKKSIIIHDLSKMIECLPPNLDKDDLNFDHLKKIVINIRNLINQNYTKKGEYDIKNCIISASDILSYNKITFDISKVKSHIFFGNEKSMIQVFINIFSNIVEHSLNSSWVRVYVNTELEKIDTTMYYVCIIKNTGSFVESDNINLILEKRFTSNSNKVKIHGSGLYYCKKIIESYSGLITCESKKGQGTSNSYFQVKLQIPTFKIEHVDKVLESKIETTIPDDFVITIIDDDLAVLNKWKLILGDKNVYYFDDPDNFILEYKDNIDVSKTKLVIFDYYFNNVPLNKLIDFTFLRDVLGYDGKIFLHTSLSGFVDDKINYDYVFQSKNDFFDKNDLFLIFNNFNELN